MTIIFPTAGKNPFEEMEYSSYSTRVWNSVLGYNLKNDAMASVHFQGKLVNITLIQVYAPTTEEAKFGTFYENLQDLLELIPKRDVLFIIVD